MTTEIRKRKIRRVSRSQQNNSNEIMGRWQRSQAALNRTKPYPERATEAVTVRRQTHLAEVGRFAALFIGGLVTTLLVARIGLKLITVNPGTPLARIIVDLTDTFLWPFSSMTESFSAPHMAMVELSSLTAVILYPFAAWCLIKLLQQVFPRHAE